MKIKFSHFLFQNFPILLNDSLNFNDFLKYTLFGIILICISTSDMKEEKLIKNKINGITIEIKIQFILLLWP